jgi:hypothetical protein
VSVGKSAPLLGPHPQPIVAQMTAESPAREKRLRMAVDSEDGWILSRGVSPGLKGNCLGSASYLPTERRPWPQNASALTTSRPARVPSPHHVAVSIESLTNFTLPSVNAILTPPE